MLCLMDASNCSGFRDANRQISCSKKKNGTDSSETSKVAKSTILLYLLCLYFVISLFGNVFRFAAEGGSFGVGTILICLMASLTFKEALAEILKKKLWFALLLLLAWLSFSSFFGNWKVGYFYLLHLTIYIIFAAGLSTLRFTLKRLNVLFLVIIITLLISTTLTSLDLASVIDVPYFNDFAEGVRTTDNIRIVGASGPFMGRSSMCTYFGPLLPVIVIYGFLSRQKALQILSFVAFVSGLTALLLSFNRAAPWAASASIMLFCAFPGNTLRKRAKVFGGSLLGVFVSLIIIYICFPDQMAAIKYKVNLTLGIGNYTEKHFVTQRNADMKRVTIAKETIKNIVANPFGHGLTSIEISVNGEEISAHNKIVLLIWATGFFAFLWIPFFAICLIYTFRKAHLSHALYCDSIKYGLFAWFLISLVHVNWATGIMWALFGILVSQCRGETKTLPSVHRVIA